MIPISIESPKNTLLRFKILSIPFLQILMLNLMQPWGVNVNFFEELKRRNIFKVAGAYLVIGWLLIESSGTIAQMLGLSDDIPQIILLLAIIGFPLILIFAWMFEFTPDGIRRTKDVDSELSVSADTGKKVEYAIITAMAFVIGFLIYDHQPDDAPDQNEEAITIANGPDQASIAVLAFADLSAEGNQEYFGDGISESILNVLAKIDELSVSSRTSSFAFKNDNRNVTDIANILNVAHVLEGSVKRAGNRVLITAQLIDAADNKHLWSDTYERELTTENIFAIQADIANSIVTTISKELGIGLEAAENVDPLTANMSAYDLYLQAIKVYSIHTIESRERLKELLERALELDPNFADAWGLYALRLAWHPSWNHNLEVPPYQHRAIEAAERVLAINPTIHNAYNALSVAYYHLHEWERVFAVVERAQKHIPDFNIDLEILLGLGYLKSSSDKATVLSALEPDNAFYYLYQGIYYEAIGEHESAIEMFGQAILRGYGSSNENIARLSWASGNKSAWVSFYAREMADKDPELLPLLPHLYELKLGLEKSDPNAVDRFKLIATEMGFELENLFEKSTRWGLRLADEFVTVLGGAEFVADLFWSNRPMMWMWRPSLHDFRQTDAWRGRVRSSGMLAYWQNHGWPDLCRPLGDDDFICD